MPILRMSPPLAEFTHLMGVHCMVIHNYNYCYVLHIYYFNFFCNSYVTLVVLPVRTICNFAVAMNTLGGAKMP